MSFARPTSTQIRSLSTEEWEGLLAFCDKNQLTLLLGYLCNEWLPRSVKSRIRENYHGQEQRLARLELAVLEIAAALKGDSVPFVLLKGLGQSQFSPDPVIRCQGDIDLWCLPADLFRGRAALCKLGYYSVAQPNSRHLAPMIREKQWNWTGNYHQPDLPIPVDLHYKLWDGDTECIPGPDEVDVWRRRSQMSVRGDIIPVLDPLDTLAFAALHLLMHILHGDLRLNRAWELAYFLHNHSLDDNFWGEWQIRFEQSERVCQTIVFALVHQWFACGLPSIVGNEVKTLPSDIHLWLNEFGMSPVEALFRPNKDEIWLHLSLMRRAADRQRLLWRRLIPVHAHLDNIGRSSGRKGGTPVFLCRRSYHHAATLCVFIVRGLKWWRLRRNRQSWDDDKPLQTATPL
ncbi:MAG: nucleotidyltransferase family protein [Acidobacteriaceae bacterium]|nr:nucleotidyltransferase family protein [Acidobacteriaceae bacterium]